MMGVRGAFVVFEGMDGAGKSTQIELTAQALTCLGLTIIITREPGGTSAGDIIRDLVLRPPHELAPTTELLLFGASRAQHVAGVIEPALAAGSWVLCDRFTGSTIAYQGYGLGMDHDLIHRINAVATGGLEPDVTIVLDLPSGDAGVRKDAKLVGEGIPEGRDMIEARDPAFHENVRQGYLALGQHMKNSILIVDARRTIDQVHQAIMAGLTGLVEGAQRHA